MDYNVTVTWMKLTPCISEDYHSEVIGDKTEYTIVDLHEGSQYNISVVVNNIAGNGSSSESITTMETGILS